VNPEVRAYMAQKYAEEHEEEFKVFCEKRGLE
jgi:hypothetical protein